MQKGNFRPQFPFNIELQVLSRRHATRDVMRSRDYELASINLHQSPSLAWKAADQLRTQTYPNLEFFCQNTELE